MTVVDFLWARCQEELEQASCSYEASPTGELSCVCDRPKGETSELLAKANIVHVWGQDRYRRPLLGILAADYAGHPDYRVDWHPAP